MIVSCGKWNASVFFTSFYVDIYGNQNNTSDLCDHLITHTDHCKKKFKGVVEMNVYTDCIDMTKIEVLLTEFNSRISSSSKKHVRWSAFKVCTFVFGILEITESISLLNTVHF
jgi:hypothetical protein